MKRGEIYWTNLDPTQGHEIKKTRPCIVVSNDVGNEFSETVTVVPLTSKTNNKKVYPFEVFIPESVTALSTDSKAKANQIRTIDKSRIGDLIGFVSKRWMDRLDRAIKIHLSLS